MHHRPLPTTIAQEIIDAKTTKVHAHGLSDTAVLARMVRICSGWSVRLPSIKDDIEAAWHLYRADLVNFFKNRDLGQEDAEDLTAETFQNAFAKWDTLKDPTKLRPWLFSIARNLWFNHVRGEKTGKRDGTTIPFEPDHALSRENPERMMVEKQSTNLLLQCIEKLPKQMERALMLTVFQNLTYLQVARLMKIKVNTVKSTIHAARSRLKECIGSGG